MLDGKAALRAVLKVTEQKLLKAELLARKLTRENADLFKRATRAEMSVTQIHAALALAFPKHQGETKMPIGKVTLINAPKLQTEPNLDFTLRRIVDAREYGLSLRTNMNDIDYSGKLIVALCDALMKATAPK